MTIHSSNTSSFPMDHLFNVLQAAQRVVASTDLDTDDSFPNDETMMMMPYRFGDLKMLEPTPIGPNAIISLNHHRHRHQQHHYPKFCSSTSSSLSCIDRADESTPAPKLDDATIDLLMNHLSNLENDNNNSSSSRDMESPEEYCATVDAVSSSSAVSSSTPTPTHSVRSRKLQTCQWNERFQELLAFREQHGHLFVPHSYTPNQQLAQWVKRQRYQYKLKMEGRHSTLTDDRELLLSQSGFVWDSHRASWHEKFQQLESFFLSHGHCNIGVQYDPTLSVWCKHQRRQMKRYVVDRASSTMTQERIDCLNSVGFDWNPRNLRRPSQHPPQQPEW